MASVHREKRNGKTRFRIQFYDKDKQRRSIRLAADTNKKGADARQAVFKRAVRKGLIDESPFAEVKGGSDCNESRLHFIDQGTIQKVLDAAPDAEWRAIIALARYGGLRTPSETLGLKWADIDWATDRFTVASPKTARQGKPSRLVPLFPELRPYLEELFDQAAPGSMYVIGRYRDKSANLRTQFQRIIQRAGVQSWERLYHNLRASRETELANEFPLHVVTDWIGNTPAVANRHYLQTVEQHFQQAIGKWNAAVGATVGAKVVQQWVPSATAPSRTMLQETRKPPAFTEVLLHGTSLTDSVRTYIIPPRGSELSQQSPGKSQFSSAGGAKSGAVGALIDTDLQAVVAAWPALPDAVKAGILAMIRAAKSE